MKQLKLFEIERKQKIYNASPLPFQGQKRYFLKKFKEALHEFPSDAIYVDLFGGSGLLSHTVKRFYPNARVIYNDYDNFSERIKNIYFTNLLLQKIRDVIPKNIKEKAPLSPIHKEKILSIIKNEKSKIDIKTISKSLFYGGTYAEKIEDIFNYKTFYNNIKHSDYNAEGYLEGLEVVHKDYKELIKEFSSLENVIFIYDPPYLSTNVESYNSVFHWKLTDYLDILDTLNGKKNFFYFTSHRGGLLELLDWIECRFDFENPFSNAKKISVKASAINTVYTDFMFYKTQVSDGKNKNFV